MRAILTFHSIDASASVLSFDPRLFDNLLAELAKKAIPVCDLETLLTPDTDTGIAFTFDDGMKSVFHNALPILRHYQVPAHLFLTTGTVGGSYVQQQPFADIPSFEMLNWQQVEALHLAGVRVECHTHTHPDMRTLTKDQIAEECGRADEMIASRLGRKPRYFAYPFGQHNQMARDFVRNCYSASVTTELRKLRVNEDQAALPRLDTYYLRSRAHIRLIDTLAMQLYFILRSGMRELKSRHSRTPTGDRRE